MAVQVIVHLIHLVIKELVKEAQFRVEHDPRQQVDLRSNAIHQGSRVIRQLPPHVIGRTPRSQYRGSKKTHYGGFAEEMLKSVSLERGTIWCLSVYQVGMLRTL
jgi:hypothetical protein